MHDGASVEIGDAIRRHQKEAEEISERFSKLAPAIKRRCWRFSNRFESAVDRLFNLPDSEKPATQQPAWSL